MNYAGNQENYRIFSPNPKTDGMKGQPYSDRFPRHHIPFLYRLSYLSNNTKMTKKYRKIELVFSKILPTVFTLSHRPDPVLFLLCSALFPAASLLGSRSRFQSVEQVARSPFCFSFLLI
jgi:hypothetical protein